MELVFIEGESKPQMMYTPYVHTFIQEYSIYYKVYSGNLMRIVTKESVENKMKEKLGGKRNERGNRKINKNSRSIK